MKKSLILFVALFGYLSAFTSAATITLNGLNPSRATVGPDTLSDGDCNHPGIDCTGTTITILEGYFQEVGNEFWNQATLGSVDTLIIEDNNFINIGERFFLSLAGGDNITSIVFPEGSLQTIATSFLQQADLSSVTTLTFPDSAFQTFNGGGFLRSTDLSSLTSLNFPAGVFETVGVSFMRDTVLSSLTELTFPAGSLQTVGDDFMNGIDAANLTTINFPYGSFDSYTENSKGAGWSTANIPNLVEINGVSRSDLDSKGLDLASDAPQIERFGYDRTLRNVTQGGVASEVSSVVNSVTVDDVVVIMQTFENFGGGAWAAMAFDVLGNISDISVPAGGTTEFATYYKVFDVDTGGFIDAVLGN